LQYPAAALNPTNEIDVNVSEWMNGSAAGARTSAAP